MRHLPGRGVRWCNGHAKEGQVIEHGLLVDRAFDQSRSARDESSNFVRVAADDRDRQKAVGQLRSDAAGRGVDENSHGSCLLSVMGTSGPLR